MNIKILNVEVTDAGTGRNKYQKAVVLFDQNGEKKTQNIVSFANPQVFKVVAEAKAGDQFSVTTGKNDKGYTTWESISAGHADSATPATSGTKAYVGASRDFETKEEREAKQRYIIRQSSLANAITVLTTGAKTPPETNAVLNLADEFVNYVFETTDLFDQANDLDTDIPH